MSDIVDRARAVLKHPDTRIGHALVADMADEIEQLKLACKTWVAEIERLKALQLDDQNNAKQAIAERDAASAKLARREALAETYERSYPSLIVGSSLRQALEDDDE